jgi:hypothetical protein
MTGARDSFSTVDVTVTLTGEEWFVVLAYLALAPSHLSSKFFDKLQSQVLAARNAASLQQEGGIRGASMAIAAADEVPGVKSRYHARKYPL